MPSCETPIQTFVTSTDAKHIILKCQPKIVLQKEKDIDCDLHKKYSKLSKKAKQEGLSRPLC